MDDEELVTLWTQRAIWLAIILGGVVGILAALWPFTGDTLALAILRLVLGVVAGAVAGVIIVFLVWLGYAFHMRVQQVMQRRAHRASNDMLNKIKHGVDK